MSVYVDPQMKWPKSQRWPYGSVSHLTADSLIELHAFAKWIELERAWFQDRHDAPHYDLSPSKRKDAVFHGATELTREQAVKRMRDARRRR